MSSPRSVPFQYWQDSAANWPDRLAALKNSGVDEIHTFIPWGLHESVQGIRDFSKASRLRLEKFLSLAHQVGLTVRATVGFPAMRESFPSWSLSLGESSTLVPDSVWGRVGDVSVSRLPSIHDEQFFSPFLEFLSDVFALLSLYRFPEGPVVGVEVDWGVYEVDLGLTALPAYPSYLQQRYPQTGLINLRYHCTFRDFATATSSQGTRVLLDKRPWLAAYDYKFCRERMLEERAQGVLALRTAEPLVDLIYFGIEVPPPPPSDSEWAIVVDPVLLEGDASEKAFLFAPLGLTNPQAVGVFRLWEYLKRQAAKDEVPLLGLKAQQVAPARIINVVAGRFLSQSLLMTLKTWAQAGATLYFPFGLPQYDENLSTIEWKQGMSRLPVRPGNGKYVRVGLGEGQICFTESVGHPEPHFWEDLRAFSIGEKEGAGA